MYLAASFEAANTVELLEADQTKRNDAPSSASSNMKHWPRVMESPKNCRRQSELRRPFRDNREVKMWMAGTFSAKTRVALLPGHDELDWTARSPLLLHPLLRQRDQGRSGRGLSVENHNCRLVVAAPCFC